MSIAARLVILLVALEHLWFLVLEMFLWNRPLGLRTFRMSAEKARDSAALAANQGLYNGFLAAGLCWSLVAEPALGRQLAIFFLACVIVAAVFGGATVSRRILIVQGVPALVGLALVLGQG